VRERDARAAGDLLAEDFVLTSEGGVSPDAPRDRWLETLASIETDVLDVVDASGRVYGDVGVVRARLHWVARVGERDLTGDYVVADVFVRSGGRWRVSWRVSTRVAA
jgi:hypothetical protein